MTRHTRSRGEILHRPSLPPARDEQRDVDQVTDLVADAIQYADARDVLAGLVETGVVTLDELRRLAPEMRPPFIVDWHETVRGKRLGGAWVRRAPPAELQSLEQLGPHSWAELRGWETFLPEDVAMLAAHRSLNTVEVRDWWRGAGALGIPSWSFAAGFCLVAVGAAEAPED